MNISSLVYVLTAGTAAVLLPLLNSIGNRRKAIGSKIYTYSIGFRIMIWVGSIGFTLMGFIFKAFGINGDPWQWIVTEIMGVLLIVGCVYTDKYAIQLDDDHITYGSFKKNTLRYNEIKSVKLVRSGRGQALNILDSRNKKFSISGNIQYINDLAENLENKINYLRNYSSRS